jgi:hypothetical protein
MKRDQKQFIIDQVRQRFHMMEPYLTERAKRAWAATEAMSAGYGGASIVCEATGISRATISKGKKELETGKVADLDRIRCQGGGRKELVEHDPDLLRALDELIDPCTRGDPESPLRWTCKSTYKIAEALQALGHVISQRSVCALLKDLNYSLQANRKTEEGTNHVDRDAQFQYINEQVKAFHKRAQPVISVDAKKKETLVIMQLAAANGNQKGSQSWSIYMIFRIKNWARRVLMGCLTYTVMKVG